MIITAVLIGLTVWGVALAAFSIAYALIRRRDKRRLEQIRRQAACPWPKHLNCRCIIIPTLYDDE